MAKLILSVQFFYTNRYNVQSRGSLDFPNLSDPPHCPIYCSLFVKGVSHMSITKDFVILFSSHLCTNLIGFNIKNA